MTFSPRYGLTLRSLEGNSLTFEEAFELDRALPPRELRDAEREFCNYLRAFDAIEGLRGARYEALSALPVHLGDYPFPAGLLPPSALRTIAGGEPWPTIPSTWRR